MDGGTGSANDMKNRFQKIIVFQQNNSGVRKIEGIRKFGGDRFSLEVISIDTPLPTLIDDSTEYLPQSISADLVLDYLSHPDLSSDLSVICGRQSIPVVAPGKKHRIAGTAIPPTCCGLSRQKGLGPYGDKFGAPEYTVTLVDGKIESISVVRGAPCGASWDAAEKIRGMAVDQAIIRIGLETQFFCSADPGGWDPINGKSPVHFAGKVHSAALKRAVASRGDNSSDG
jgi:thymidylate synthase